MEIYFDREKIGFDKVYDRYRKNEFDSPTRSTIPLLDLIKKGKETLQEIEHQLGVEGEPSYHLEYRVCSPNGKNSISQTDLWIETESQILGIEAKWTEPRDVTVESWMKKGKNPDNKQTVLQGWIDILSRFSNHPLDIDGMKNQVYQMVHRAASACSCTANPILAYVQFVEGFQRKGDFHIDRDLSSLWSVLGKPEEFPFYYVEVLIERNPAFKQIEHLEKRSVETGKKVKEALSGNEPLFTYKDKRIHMM